MQPQMPLIMTCWLSKWDDWLFSWVGEIYAYHFPVLVVWPLEVCFIFLHIMPFNFKWLPRTHWMSLVFYFWSNRAVICGLSLHLIHIKVYQLTIYIFVYETEISHWKEAEMLLSPSGKSFQSSILCSCFLPVSISPFKHWWLPPGNQNLQGRQKKAKTSFCEPQ